jgi:hypothetical protein
MHELVDQLPDGCFHRFTDAWPKLRSTEGRIDMYLLVEYLLFEENVSFLLTVPSHEKLRDVVSVLTIYTAFLIGCNDNQYRKCYELLHRMSTLYRQYEINEENKKLYEFVCPRKYRYQEPFSHFAFGWQANFPTGDTNSMEASHSDNAPARTEGSGSGHSTEHSSDGYGYNDSESGDQADLARDNNFSPENDAKDDASSESEEPMGAAELRMRVHRNMYHERMRAVDAKSTNQRLKPGAEFLLVERLRFIPERAKY